MISRKISAALMENEPPAKTASKHPTAPVSAMRIKIVPGFRKPTANYDHGNIRQLKPMSLASRVSELRPSPTLAMTARARAMRDAGHDVISLAAGEPDFNTPSSICDYAIDAIRKGKTKYTASSGIPELKSEIAKKLARDSGIEAKPAEIVVSCGAKHSIYNACMALVNPGDEVILIAPYWMTYAEQVRLAGGEPIVIHTAAENGFSPTVEQLRAAVSPKTAAIIINSPSNPTGAVLPANILVEIAGLANQHDFWVVTDEIYERLVYSGPPPSIARVSPEIVKRLVLVNGCSKTYSMTGWRIGYCWAPGPVAAAIANFQDQVTSNPTSFAQEGAVAALRMPDAEIESMRAEFEARRDLVLAGLDAIGGLTTAVPQGAFYVFPNVSKYLGGKCADDVALANHILEEGLVATVPGSVFEGPNHIRLSYAASREQLKTALDRIARVLHSL